MKTKNNIVDKIEQKKSMIRYFGVQKLTLVGSQAKETANKTSDVDLIVEFVDGRGSFDDFVHLKQFLEDLLHAQIDLGEKSYVREEIKESMFGGRHVEARI